MHPTVSLALVALVAACRAPDATSDSSDTACAESCCNFVSVEYEREDVFVITEEEFVDIAGEDGVLTTAECLDAWICEHYSGGQDIWLGVAECRDEGVDAQGHTLYCRTSWSSICEGRSHAGLEPAHRARTDTGTWLAEAAAAEAGSVLAFQALAAELREHGAPEALLQRLMSACRDEVRHADRMDGLARAFGARPNPPRLRPLAPRTLVAIAVENAVEGCVNETFAAAVALWQSEQAEDPAVRAAMREIARDEIVHAELAAALDRWFRDHLSPAAAAMVDAARDRATATLRWTAPDLETRRALGLPDATTGARLVAGIRAFHAA